VELGIKVAKINEVERSSFKNKGSKRAELGVLLYN
jgi:hypothetical protein